MSRKKRKKETRRSRRQKRQSEHAREPKPEQQLEGLENERPELQSEALEPRIMLSATWVDADTLESQSGATADADLFTGDDAADVADGLAGDDILFGEGGDDILTGGAGDDLLDGGSGTDIADYSSAPAGVTVDLTIDGPQDTGSAGVDTLTNLEGVQGSDHDDTFAFSSPTASATYSVDGGGGSNLLDLSGFDQADATIDQDGGTITVDLGGGDSFTVEYTNVDGLRFSDGTASLVEEGLISDAGPDVSVEEGNVIQLDGTGSEGPGVTWEQAGDETLVNTTTSGDQDIPEVATFNDGSYVIVWEGGDTDGAGIFAQHYDAAGTPVGSEFQVNTTTSGDQRDPEISVSENGNFVVTWQGEDADGEGIYGQLYDADGNTLGAEFQLNSTVEGTQESPSIAMSADGSFVATWQSDDQGVVAQRFDSSGNMLGSEIQISADDAAASPSIAVADDGGFVVVWEGDDAHKAGVIARVYDANGSPVGAEFQVNTSTFGDQTQADVSMASDGSFVIAWQGGPADNKEIFAQRYDAGGATLGTEIQVNTTSDNHQDMPDVSMADDGSFVVVWQSGPGNNDDVFGQAYDADGNPASPEFQINTDSNGRQHNPSVSMVDDGRFVVTWEGPDANGSGVYLQGYSLNPDPPTTYEWVQTGGPSVTLDDATSATPSFTAPEGVSNMEVTFELRVSDGGVTVADTVVITVNADDDAPSANAGPDQVVDEGDAVSLAASGTDPEGQSLTYTWVQTSGPTVTLDDPNASSPTFTAPEGLANSDVTFELQASDGTNVSVDSVTVTVNADNDAPSATAGTDQVVDEGDVVSLSGSGTDPEGQGLTYTWVQTGGTAVTLDDPNASSPSFTAPEGLSNSDVTFELQVSDGTNVSVDSVTVTVNADNDAPSATAGTDQTVNEGDVVALSGSGTDPEGQGLTYTWVQTGGTAVTLDDPDASSPSFTAPEGLSNSDVTFELQVSDGTNVSVDSVTVTVNADNDAPTATAGIDLVASEGDVVALSGSGTDPEGQGLTYTWVQTGGTAVTLSDPNASSPSFTAPEGLSNSDVTFELQVSDGTNVSVDSVTVTVNADDDAPSATAGTNQVVAEGDVVSLSGSGTDPEGQGLTYTWVQTGGTAVTLDDPNASSPSFTAPEGLSNSDVIFELQVSDGTNVSVDSVTVTVNADNDAPSATAGTDQIVGEGDVVALSGSGTDPEGQGLTYTWVQTGGTAVTLDDPNASSPTFTAPEGLSNSDVTFELQVSDGTNVSVDSVTVTVNADDDAPSATAGTDQIVAEGDVVSLSGSGTDPEGQGLTYTWVQTGGTAVTLDDPNASSPTFTAPEGLSDSDVTFELQVSDGSNVSVDSVTVTVNADNDAPSATAGTDQIVGEGDVVALSGSGTDPEGQGLTYTWVQTGGTAVTLDDPNASSPTFTAPEGLSNSDVTFELQVSDGTNVSVDSVTVTVNADDDAPSATAGTDQVVAEGDVVSLSGSGTDPEGQGLTYTWVQTGGTAVTLDDPNASSPSFTAPEGLSNSDVIFELQVSDGTNVSVDSVTVTVNADNDAPTASAGVDQLASEGDPVVLSGSGTDPEGQGLTYTWVQTGGTAVTLSDPNASSPTFTAPEGLSNSDVVFELQVSDGTNVSVDSVTVTVNADNDAPSATAGANQVVDEGDVVLLSGSGTDPEGQGLTYTWVQTGGTTVTLDDPNASSPTFTAPEGLSNSDVTFELQVSDGANTSVDSVTVTVNADNDAPSATAGANQVVAEGDVVSLSGSGTDPEGQGLTYTWVQTGGTAVTLDDPNASSPTFTAPEGLSNSDVTFELQVSDGTNVSVDSVTITVNADDDAPSATAGTDQVVAEGDVVALSGAGTDPEGQGLTYTWVQTGGTAVTLDDPNASSPSFTAPEGLSNSDVTFELQVSDGTNVSVDSVTITVNADDDAPSATAGANQVVDEGDVVLLSGSGTDPEGQGLTYTWVQTGGTAVTLDDPNASSPSFTAPEGLSNSDVTFELQVSDGTNTSVDAVTITINADNDAPSASTGGDQIVDEGDLVSLSGFGSDPEGQGLTYTWVQTGGPTIALTDATTDSPVFTAPEGVTNTNLTFEVQVSDGTNVSADSVTVTVNADDDAPSASAGAPQIVEEGNPVALSGSATDPEGQGLTYNWVQTGGSTVTLSDPTSATPTFTAPEGFSSSDLTFELQVSDGTNTSVDSVVVTVDADDDAPTADAGGDQSVQEGDLVALSADGYDAEGLPLSFRWVQTSGPGVTLSSSTASSPTFMAPEGIVNSDVVFALQVSDGNNVTADTVVITIGANDDAPTADAGPMQNADAGDRVTLSGRGTDPEGAGLTYEWVQLGGPSVTLSDANSASPTFVVPDGLDASDLVFELRVSDGANIAQDTVIVRVAGGSAEVDPFADIDGPAEFDDPQGFAPDPDLVQDAVLSDLPGVLPVADPAEAGPMNLASLFNDVVELSDETSEPASDTPTGIADLANRSSFHESFQEVGAWTSLSDDRPASDGVREEVPAEPLAPLPTTGHPSDDWREEPDDQAKERGGRFGMFAALWGMLRGNAGSETRSDNDSRKERSNH